MRNQEWDPAPAQLHPLDLAKLVFGLLGRDAVHREAALGVVDEPEVLARALDADDVHETGRVGGVGAHFAVDLDEPLHQDGFGFAVVEGIFQTAVWRRERRVVSKVSSVRRLRFWMEVADRFRMKMTSGMQSLSLWGPGDARGA